MSIKYWNFLYYS